MLRLFLTPSNWPAVAPLLLSLALLGGCGGGEGIILPEDGEPAAIAVTEGDGQRGRVREPLIGPLVVQVTDTRGRPVRGATVAFELASAGSVVVPPQKTTNADGKADARLVLGTTFGRQTGNARVVTQEGRPPLQVGFSAMALSEDANTMTAEAGQDQSGHVGTQLDERLVVRVTDEFENPVEGIPITWAAEGGGSVSAAVVETDEDGLSRVRRILGPTVGQQTTVASSEGLAGSPLTFVHTALAGDASRLVVVSGSGQTAPAGSALPADLVVQLVDADGNGIPATAVSWVVATGGGRANPENSTTDGGGRASAKWTLGDAVGEQRLDAVVSGVAGGVATFRATATSRGPASLDIRTQPSGSARDGVPFVRQPVIQLRDGAGNDVGVAGVEVSVAIGSGRGALGGTSRRTTDASGRATFTDLSISGADGGHTVVFTASGLTGVISNEIAVTGTATATTTTITADSPDPSVAGSQFPVEFRVTSGSTTPTGTVRVTVSGGAANCTGTLSGGVGSCTLRLGGLGDRTITATYSGAPGLSGSSDTEPHRVEPAQPENEAPSADFNWHCEDLTCFFTDASEDDDGTITNRHWDFGDGATIDNQLTPSHTYAAPGDYRVILTVTDNGGLTDDAQDTVDPEAPQPQSLRIREQPSGSATVGVVFGRQPDIELRVGDRDLERAGVTISASIASGGGTLGGTTTATTDENGRAEFSNLSISGATGPHTLIFSADGFASVTSNSIEVRKTASQTDINSADNAVVGTPVRVDFSVTGAGGTPTGTVTVAAQEGPGESCTGSVADGFCMLTFTAPGDRNIRATYGGDERFEGSSDDVSIEVSEPENVPPTAAFTAPTCTVNVPCDFSAGGSSDPEGPIVSWDWDFGPSASPTSSTDENPLGIVFPAANSYPVTLTVTDNQDATGTTIQQVNVP